MKVVIIGGSGHIGTYLAPGLVEAGYESVHWLVGNGMICIR